MSGNFAIKGGGVGRLLANAILNFHFDFLNPSLSTPNETKYEKYSQKKGQWKAWRGGKGNATK